MQCIKQAQWPEENPVLALPGMVKNDGSKHEYSTKTMNQLLALPTDRLDTRLPKEVYPSNVKLKAVFSCLGSNTPS